MNAALSYLACIPRELPPHPVCVVRVVADMSAIRGGVMVPFWACTLCVRGDSYFGVFASAAEPSIRDLTHSLEAHPDRWMPVSIVT